jgi:PAS domain S-box-containing protein
VKQATGEITEKARELSKDARVKDSLLRELSSGLIVVDRDEKVVMMNRAAEELLGISKEEMIGHHILEHIKSEHLLALTKRREGRVELSSPEDQTREVIRSSTAVVEDEDGRPIGMLFVLTDVARQRELDRVKEDFFLRLSHHLKDPLKAIQDAMILLLSRTSGEINEEQRRLLTMAKENSEELLSAFTKLLTASDARRGTLDITPSTFDLISLIEGSVDRFSGWAKDKGVIVKKALPKAIVNVTADREKITLVLDNIIANALKATGEGGEINIMADSTRDEDEKENVLVEVVDTGRGIPSSEIERVFDEFSQAVQREGEFSGLGMGLSIARDIISRHGGKIWIESELGKGSRVKFTLPVSKAES